MEPFRRRLRVRGVEANATWSTAWDDSDADSDDLVIGAVVWTFDEFYAASRPGLMRGLALTLGDPDLAADAADEALTKAYLRWNHVSQLDNPAGWTYRVGLNWARSIVRRRRGPARAIYSSTTVDLPPMADPQIHAALGGLNVKQRGVVVCRFLLGWTEQETADALGVRLGTVKSRQHRALAELEQRLGHLRPEPRPTRKDIR